MPRNGVAFRNALNQRVAHFERIQRAHHLSEMADARQQDLVRLAQTGGIAYQPIFAANLIQRVLHRPQVARAVIEDGDHSSPFVDGS